MSTLELEPVGVVFLEMCGRGSVHVPAIPNHDHLAAIMAVQLPKQPNHVFGGHVFRNELKIQRQFSPHGRNANQPDRGESIVAIPGVLQRRLARRSPRAATHGLQHEAAFIQEYKGR